MAPKIELITEGATLGEGPHWDAETQSLYFVDIFKKLFHKYVPATGRHTQVSFAPLYASFIIPVQGMKDHFIVPLDSDISIISWDGESDTFKVVEKIDSAPDGLNFNDAKCDSTGRLWAGTHKMHQDNVYKTEPVGTLYRLNPEHKKLSAQVRNVHISNGLCWNDGLKKMFYIDSLKEVVDCYDYDPKTGNISNCQPWFTYKKHNVSGAPDGMSIDSDGNLWVACFGAGRAIKVDGKKPETLLDTVEIPDFEITSTTWGGKNLDELYVTSASFTVPGLEFPQPPKGATYKITGLGVKGSPGNSFKFQ